MMTQHICVALHPLGLNPFPKCPNSQATSRRVRPRPLCWSFAPIVSDLHRVALICTLARAMSLLPVPSTSYAHPAFRRGAGHSRGIVRPLAASGGGTIVREVMSGSGRTKLDSGNDREFYSFPRLVKHVDDGFLAQLTQLYRNKIKPGAAVLDLMSSWVSHLPPEVSYARVVGHGLNAAELAKNPRLSEFFVRDLNREPDGWAVADQSFDAVLCCVSVQYLQQPERVMAEVFRVLRPGGVVVLSFSSRMFYTKAVAAWRDSSEYGRVQLVRSFLGCVEGFTQPETVTKVELPAPTTGLPAIFSSLAGLLGRATGGDPFYAVVAYREFKPPQQAADV